MQLNERATVGGFEGQGSATLIKLENQWPAWVPENILAFT